MGMPAPDSGQWTHAGGERARGCTSGDSAGPLWVGQWPHSSEATTSTRKPLHVRPLPLDSVHFRLSPSVYQQHVLGAQ